MRIVSSASRNIKKLTSTWLNKTPFKQLTWRKISRAGRSQVGRIVIWTKSSIKHRLLYPKINYNEQSGLRYRRISFVSTFRLIPFQNKLVALAFFSNGSISVTSNPLINIKFSTLFISQLKLVLYENTYLTLHYSF